MVPPSTITVVLEITRNPRTRFDRKNSSELAQILKTSACGAHLRGAQPPRPPFSRELMILEGARAETRKKSGKTRREKTV